VVRKAMSKIVENGAEIPIIIGWKLREGGNLM